MSRNSNRDRRVQKGVWLCLFGLALTLPAAAKECRYTAAPHSTITIINQFGDVKVKTGSGREVTINASPASAAVSIECSQVGNRIDAVSRLQPQASAISGRVDYEISVPSDVALSVRDSDGAIHVDGAGSDDTLRSDVSEVDASNLRNVHLHIVTVSGPVNLNAIRGGHLQVLSATGNVRLENVDAPRVSISTTSGNISYDGDFGADGEYLFNNHSGNIEVTAPAAASIDLDARSLRGSVENDFPLQQRAEPASAVGRSFAGTSHSGSSSVQLRSFSGTIRVKKR